MSTNFSIVKNKLQKHTDSKPHPKCLGYHIPDPGHGWGDDIGCGYESKIDCDECKYNGSPYPGRKDPAAKVNQFK